MTATVLDSFVLEFGVDDAKLDAGMRRVMDNLRKMQEESTKGATQVESQHKAVLNSILDFRREALGILGVFLGGRGIKEFTDYITNTNVALGNLSKTLGLSATEINSWGIAFEKIGGTAQSAQGALAATQQAIEQARITGHYEVFGPLGRFIGDVRQYKSAADLWLAVGQAFQGMDPALAAQWMRMVPGANPDMINFALRGRQYMQQSLSLAAQERPITPADIKAAQDYKSAVTDITTAFTNLMQTVLNPILPVITRWINNLNSGLLKYNENLPAQSATQAQRFEEQQEGTRNFWHWLHRKVPFIPDMAGRSSPYGALTSGVFGEGGASENWQRFLAGLSYLETNQTNAQAYPGHSASGYFQFEPGTAARATAAGLSDPRRGGYTAQMAATMAFIRRFYPAAAEAIDRGDYATAEALLRGVWPSLPGGSQSQSAARYGRFNSMLAGGAPGAGAARSPVGSKGWSSRQTTVNIQKMEINAPNATDSAGVAQHLGPQLQKTMDAANYNGGGS